MGVRHLETFIKTKVPDGYYDISVKDKCKQLQKANNGQKPILVIDLMGLLNSLVKDKAEMLCGGRHNKFLLMIDEFLKLMSEYAELVFFEDGPVVDEKANTWFERQKEKYNKSIEIIDKIYDNQTLESIVSDTWNIHSDVSDLFAIEHMAIKYGRRILTVTKECDAELAKFANSDPRVLAVLADDTDFLIFPGHWRYWSLRQLNIETLETKEYDKWSLRKFLNLSDKHMRILATLGGNDIMQYEQVEYFHQQNCGHQCEVKFPWLANFISNSLPTNFNDLINEIARKVVGDDSKTTKDTIYGSLAQYNTRFELPDFKAIDPLLQFCQINHMDLNFSVLQGLTRNFVTIYYDMRPETSPLLFDSENELFSKQIGVLLQHRRLRSGITRFKIRAKATHQEDYREHIVRPEFPSETLPPLLELLNREDHPEHDKLRFKIISWIIDEDKLKNVDFEKIPKKYLGDVLTLCFLTSRGLITITEADFVLRTISVVEQGELPEDVSTPTRLNVRAFHIAFLFTWFHASIARSLQTVGLQKSMMKLLNFDGVLYHQMFSTVLNSELGMAKFRTEFDDLRLYK